MGDDKKEEKGNPVGRFFRLITPPIITQALIASAKVTAGGAVRTKEFCVTGAKGVKEYNRAHPRGTKDKEEKEETAEIEVHLPPGTPPLD